MKTQVFIVFLLPYFLCAQGLVLAPSCVIHGNGENRIYVGVYHGNGSILDFSDREVTAPLKEIFLQYCIRSIYVEGKQKGTQKILSESTEMNSEEKSFFNFGIKQISGLETRIPFLNSKEVYTNNQAATFHRKIRATARVVKDSVMIKSKTGPEYVMIKSLSECEVDSLSDYFEMALAHIEFEQSIAQLPDSVTIIAGVVHVTALAAHGVPGRYFMLVSSSDLNIIVDDYYKDQCLIQALISIKK